MSATGQPKQNCSLDIIRSSEELEKIYSQDQKDPDLFELLANDCSYEIYIKTGTTPKNRTVKGCRCSKSGCLKMYCQCLAGGKNCGPECGCVSCCNQPQNIQTQSESLSPQKAESLHRKWWSPGTSKPSRGCNCRRSGCEKRYCQCFNNGLKCTQLCHCMGCNNCQRALSISSLESTNELL